MLVPRTTRHGTVALLLCAITGVASRHVPTAQAQVPRAPERGGLTVSLGQPPRWRLEAGVGAGAFLAADTSEALVRGEFGAYHPLFNPVTGLPEGGMEVYAGMRGNHADGGVRAMMRVPILGSGIGADYSIPEQRLNMLIMIRSPVRRGGIFGKGTQVRLDWYPLRAHSFTLSVTTPLKDPLAGRSRPARDHVVVAGDYQLAPPHRAADPALAHMLDSLRVSAEWIRRLVVPFLDQDGRDGAVAIARTERYVAQMRTHLEVRSQEAEVRYFHAEMARLFAVASQRPAAADSLARWCRRILLEEVLLPYDKLLGRKRKHDTLNELNIAARGRFARRVAESGLVPEEQTDDVLYAFQGIGDILETERRRAGLEWDDPRLTWLPLQYGLLPEEHDEQAEIDSLIEGASGNTFTDHNHIHYVANVQFHRELLQMIRETRRFHVLWIHDFPAIADGGSLDTASFAVVEGYLAALTHAVERYDSGGTLPSFFIFLDEHYYEERHSHVLMDVLEDPLGYRGDLPIGDQPYRERLARSLRRLEAAVRRSHVLDVERREYGEAWVHCRIKVHVNITNRPDPSYMGGDLVGGLFGYSDDVMRDHRKISFRDVSEDAPFDGVAVLTGMGVGQQYMGPGWDDRALVLHGPILLDLKRAARDLLLSQGVRLPDLPPPFVEHPVHAPVAMPTALPDAPNYVARAMALFNGTGYTPKPLNAAKAVLYSLMPPGTVFKIPDSLWNSDFFAGLLVGACLRGAEVLLIAPAQANAPSGGFPQMAREHELMARLLLVRGGLGSAMRAADGDLRIGLYALPIDERGFASRAAQWATQVDTSSFLRTLWPFAAGLVPQVAAFGAPTGAPTTAYTRAPKLHQKVQFMATRPFWRAVVAAPEWPQFMATYLRYRDATYTVDEQAGGTAALEDSLEAVAQRMLAHAGAAPGAASYAFVGSQNMDYRGMFMDGEVGVLLTGAESLLPLIDIVFMVGTVTWVDDTATLDRLLPPPGEWQRRIGRFTKDGI
jgi:hypothetical protein